MGSININSHKVCSMVCNRSWHLPSNIKQVWHPARIIKEGWMCGSVYWYHASWSASGYVASALTLLHHVLFFGKSNHCFVIVLKGTISFGELLWRFMVFVCRCSLKAPIHSFAPLKYHFFKEMRMHHGWFDVQSIYEIKLDVFIIIMRIKYQSI